MSKGFSKFLLIVVSAVSLRAQSSSTAQSSSSGPPKEGKVVLQMLPINLGSSLHELVTGSRLIVDGTVVSTLPPITTNTGGGQPLLETHSVVTVNSTLKGSVPNGATTILVAQVGGRSGEWDISVDGDVLLGQEERYILFLQGDDERKNPPNASGLPRYSVVGIWSGKAKITDQKVEFLPKVSQALQKSNGSDAAAFVQEIKDRVSGKYVPPQGERASTPHPHPPAISKP